MPQTEHPIAQKGVTAGLEPHKQKTMKKARVFEPSRSLVHLIEREKGTPEYETASSASANALGFRTFSADSDDSVETKREKAMHALRKRQIDPSVFPLLQV